MRRPLFTVSLTAVAIAIVTGCGGGGGGGGGGGPSEPEPVLDRPAFDLHLIDNPLSESFRYDDHLRANGVYLLPRGHAAVAAIDENPRSILRPNRRIQVAFVELDAADSDYGELVGPAETVYGFGGLHMRGLSATSFRDTDGSVDGLLIAIEPDTRQVLATTLDGAAETGGVLGTEPVSGISEAQLTPTVIPAVESGTRAGETHILMAYAAPSGSGPRIHVGLLQRDGPAAWRFERRSQVPTSEPGGSARGCRPAWEIAAAFDARRAEFLVAWECGSFSAYARRFDFDGNPVGPAFLAHAGLEALHSGVTLSYNRVVDRYLFTLQHNTALMSPGPGGTLSCVPDPAVGCKTVIPGCLVGTGSQWAAEVDYTPGFEFRVGADARRPLGGASYRLIAGRQGIVCRAPGVPPPDWELESELWPARAGSLLHEFVRCPRHGLTVALHTLVNDAEAIGQLRYSLLDEPTSIPFDE